MSILLNDLKIDIKKYSIYKSKNIEDEFLLQIPLILDTKDGLIINTETKEVTPSFMNDHYRDARYIKSTIDEIKEALEAKSKSCENCSLLVRTDFCTEKCNFLGIVIGDELKESGYSCSKHEPK